MLWENEETTVDYMPIDNDYDNPAARARHSIETSLSQPVPLKVADWNYSIGFAVTDITWRDTLLAETGAESLEVLAQWIVKANEQGWSASQMIEAIHKKS